MDSFLQRFKFLKKKKKEETEEIEELILLTQHEKAMVMSRSDDQLMDIVKNYRQYNYSEDVRKASLRELKKKGYSEEHIKLSGNFENIKYSRADLEYKEFRKHSNKALLFYGLSLVCFVFLVLAATIDINLFGGIAEVFFYLRPIAILIFIYYAIRAAINESKFYDALGKKRDNGITWIILLLGLLVYVLIFFYTRKRMKEDLQMIR